MKRAVLLLAFFIVIGAQSVLAADLQLLPENIRFSRSDFLEGAITRIYANIVNTSGHDLRGVVRFFDGSAQIRGDQPVSALAGKDDAVFVDWFPVAGEHLIKVTLIAYDAKDDNPTNNTVEKNIRVLADTDRDGMPNSEDIDDDNDGAQDNDDAFPLNKAEQKDSDGDTIGNNQDDDDDNDGVKDADDTFPLDANESKDADKDGVGDYQDLYPADPTQTRDYDKDGISDERDPDADNDGKPKSADTNDTNLSPVIVITTLGKMPDRITAPGEEVTFETSKSFDPDSGQIKGTEWTIDNVLISGDTLKHSFPAPGIKRIAVNVTDDKGETTKKTFNVYVAPRYFPWAVITIFLLIGTLATYKIFTYTKAR